MNELLDPLQRVRDVNPVHEADLPAVDTEALLREIVGAPLRLPRPRRWVRRAAPAGVVAVAAAALTTVPLLLPAGDSSRWTPNAAAASLDALAAQVRTPALGDRYLYVRSTVRQLEVIPDGGRNVRYFAVSDLQDWTGSHCDDQATGTDVAVDFPASADRDAWPDLVRRRPELQVVPGRSTTSRGPQLWESMPDYAHTDNPCAWPGAINQPNPNYVAGLPDEPRALLDRLTRDDAALGNPGSSPGPAGLRGYLLMFIGLPWLTDGQRAAMIRALGLLPGGLRATGHVTVAGHRGLVLTEDGRGFRTENVLSADAPGILRFTMTVTDPAQAAASYPGLGFLPSGTVVSSRTLVETAVVPEPEVRRP